MKKNESKSNFLAIYLLGFFFTFNIAIPAYINSTFLNEFISEKIVGVFFTVASLLTIISFVWMPVLLRKIGNFKTALLFSLLNLLVLLVAGFSSSIFLVIPALVIHLILTSAILFNFDVFLESFSKDNTTGRVRGSYLSIRNIGWVISPIITGLLLTNSDYWKVYFLGAILMVPVIFILIKNFRKFEDPEYVKIPFWETLKVIFHRRNVRKILISDLVLKFFFSWMVIYTPIYLHEYIGFSWGVIGVIFTIMLLPFALLEMPLGRLADEKFGEKEMLSAGFIIMGITTMILTFITSTNPAIWAMLLFITRVGASIVEVMSETYFFKKIDGDDTNILSFYRMTRPIAYIFSPIVASILLIFLDFNYLFLVLGIIVLVVGLIESLRIIDTK